MSELQRIAEERRERIQQIAQQKAWKMPPRMGKPVPWKPEAKYGYKPTPPTRPVARSNDDGFTTGLILGSMLIGDTPRCPKGRVSRPEDWRGVWQCLCGSEELDDALGAASAAYEAWRLSGGTPQ